MNCVSAHVLGAGSPLAVCAPRDLKLGISQYLVLPSASSGSEGGGGDVNELYIAEGRVLKSPTIYVLGCI